MIDTIGRREVRRRAAESPRFRAPEPLCIAGRRATERTSPGPFRQETPGSLYLGVL